MGLSHVSSEVRGTFGYVDPEYQIDRHVHSSSDVYSFGVVLLQILSGQRVINLQLAKPMPLSKMVTFFYNYFKYTSLGYLTLNTHFTNKKCVLSNIVCTPKCVIEVWLDVLAKLSVV